MKREMFTIWDSKQQMYGEPFYAFNSNDAIRYVQTRMAQQPESMIARYPEDFQVWKVGEFNCATGWLEPLGKLLHVISLSSLVKESVNVDERSSGEREPESAARGLRAESDGASA